jgi:hypothetical protein
MPETERRAVVNNPAPLLNQVSVEGEQKGNITESQNGE